MNSATHPIAAKFVLMKAPQGNQIPDPFWQRFKIALTRVGAEALSAPGQSSKGGSANDSGDARRPASRLPWRDLPPHFGP
jgi:hypothetical protein